MRRPGSVTAAAVTLIATAAAAAAFHFFVAKPAAREAELPRLGRVPEFTLVSEAGKTVGRKDLAGRVVIADFIFIRCAGTCPMMTRRMAALADAMRGEPGVRFVSFDVDPDRDSVADLAVYARAAAADPARWTFLRGEKPAIVALARDGFKLAVVDGDAKDPEPILHSTRFVLVDPSGEIRGYYDSAEEPALLRLARDARRLSRDPG